jgi:hypothetical protein
MQKQKKRQKHNYTSELELKSLLIRIKNKRKGMTDEKLNSRINKYIKWHTAINNKKYKVPTKRNIIKSNIKEKIIELSEQTCTDSESYEQFGKILLLMVKNILKKPQFSGYTYRDDFYSDSIHKILKYLHNFDHTMISERTGLNVNSFAYISQIIHNSILFIIGKKKEENINLKKHVNMQDVGHDYKIKTNESNKMSSYNNDEYGEIRITETIEIEKLEGTLLEKIIELQNEIKDKIVTIIYPKTYSINFEEYDKLKPFLTGKLSIIRARDVDHK